MATDPLQGRRVLVTRPAGRAEGLVAALEAAGAAPIHYPAIEIEPVPLSPDDVAPLDAYAAVLFVSPAAVAHGLPALGAGAGDGVPFGAVGAATAGAVRDAGHAVAIEPVGSQDSEGLLRAPALAADRIAGRRVLIVRGQGGRELLADGLMARGAAVDYAEVYRRRRPSGLDPALPASCEIVTATSNEGLSNLLAMLDEATRGVVLTRPIAVGSERIAALARARGFACPPRIAPAPGDAGLLEAIRRCAAELPEGPSESA